MVMEERDRQKYFLQAFQIRMYRHTGKLTKRILCECLVTAGVTKDCLICKGAGWYRKKD
jgi:hypothetical protein